MPDERNALKLTKTKQLVYDAMKRLMTRRRFEQITVYELCEEALISRATFYVHFEDKYHLLRLWLTYIIEELYQRVKDTPPAQKEEFINEMIHQKIVENLLLEAGNETLDIVFDVICSFSDLSADKDGKLNPEQVVLSNFYIGGLISYLKWQARHKFPKEIAVWNEHLYAVIKDYFT